jgi:hypothetical protein
MSEDRNIALVEGHVVVDDLAAASRIAEIIVKSGFGCGHDHRSAIAAILAGQAMGVSPFLACRFITIINGVPTVWGELLRSRADTSPECVLFESGCYSREEVEALAEDLDALCGDLTGDQARAERRLMRLLQARARSAKPGSFLGWAYTVRRRVGREASSVHVVVFDDRDAEMAGLAVKKGPWQQYRKRMLMHRAAGYLVRDVYPAAAPPFETTEEAVHRVTQEPARVGVTAGPELLATIEEAELAHEPDRAPERLPSETVETVIEGPATSDPDAWMKYLAQRAIEQGADREALTSSFREHSPQRWTEMSADQKRSTLIAWAPKVEQLAGVELGRLVDGDWPQGQPDAGQQELTV